ncbi:hypothetical protein MtrunA17_Chr5g0440081 [Medicago truncatula]|uniref:Structural maintenance of chromosomes protein n=1 Tax=Medicago truncatula TaxID=3880 RepID=A0A396HVN7_MEDTR|nr:hypothetical protein MtrunA17_Chr5g0440081 [Medicago truncatula]
MYNEVLDAHEKSNNLENNLKDITKEHKNFIKEKEVIEKQQTTAFNKRAELDVKDLQEKISRNERDKGDAEKELKIFEKQIEDSMDELGKISPIYDGLVQREKDITMRYNVVVHVY